MNRYEGGRKMVEKIDIVDNAVENKVEASNNLPAEINFWSRVRTFWCTPIDWHKEIKLELTSGEQEFVNKMHDFWFQDVSFKGVKEFWCQPIDWHQEVTWLGSKKKPNNL